MDTDPNPEVSALLSALDDSPKPEATDTGEAESTGELEAGSAEESAQDEASDDQEQGPVRVEFDGKTWELPPGTPPELAAGVKKMADDLKADYTRKSQSVAELKRHAEESAKAVQQQAEFVAATSTKVVELREVQRQIEQIEAIDFNALADTDPQQAIRLQAAHTRLIQAREAKQREVFETKQQAEALTAQQRQRALEQAAQELKKAVPDFTPAMAQAIRENTKAYGFTEAELENVTDHRLVLALRDAMAWRQLQAKKPEAMKKVAEAPKVIKPQAPMPKRENKSAADRLRTTGRASELINFL
jgi:uncharacterized protein YciI